MRELLIKEGAEKEHQGSIARLPRTLVEKQLNQAQKKFVLGARAAKRDIVLDGKHTYTRPIGGPDHVVDIKNQENRELTTEDLIHWTTLLDALENISYCMVVYPMDMPLKVRDVYALKLMMERTEKHIHVQPYGPQNIKFMHTLATHILSSCRSSSAESLFSVLISCTSPLRFDEENVAMLKVAAENRVPIMMNSSPMAGATGPVTLAGSVTLLIAEVLAANTIIQTIHPGSPVVCQARSNICDMRTSICARGYIEHAVGGAIVAQLMRTCYGFATDVYGASTDSKGEDIQAGIDKTHNVFLPALAGADIIAGAGLLDSGGSVSLTQLVIDDDILGRALRVLNGITINEETIALHLIKSVGPGGQFLDSQHTFRNFRTALLRSDIANFEPRAMWDQQNPEKFMVDKARRKAQHLLKTHQVPLLAKDTRKELDEILKEAHSAIN